MVAEMNGNATDVDNKDHICVAVRFRPLSEKELSRGDHEVWNCQGNAVGIITEDVGMDVKFVYDHVFPAGFSNQGVYDTVASSIVKSSLDGINGTVFAYGVTSSGKTHTMMGDDVTPGIVPHAIAEVFHLVDKMSKRKEYTIKLSMLEIYNEIVNDLLEPNNANLRLREDPRKGVVVEGIKEERLKSADHALHVVATGNEHRKISATAFNEGSSRSHTIIRLSIEANDRPEFAKNPNERIGRTFSYLTMVDLAGSESAKAEINRSQRMEGSFINKSLLTLGTVINKLSEGGAAHIPFRDSKLTRILSNSLTGNGARIAVVCTITPASTQAEETHNTLKFASRAKKITIEAKRNEILEQSTLIARYQQELELLRRQLEHYKNAGPAQQGAGGSSGVSDVEVLTLREKFEEEHMAVVELEKEKESLTSHVDRLTQCVLDSNAALGYLEKRLRDHLAYPPEQNSIDEECMVLRRQVSALVDEIRDRDRVLQQLANDGKDVLVSMEEDVALQVMMAEREYMQAHVQEMEERNKLFAAALDKMRKRTASAEGIDPSSIDMEAIIRGDDDGSVAVGEGDGDAIQKVSAHLQHDTIDAMREKFSKLQKIVKTAIDKIGQDEQNKKEKEKRQEEMKQALLSQNVLINEKLKEYISENRNLKKELARVEAMKEQYMGFSVDHLSTRELNELTSQLTQAMERVRVTFKFRKMHEIRAPLSTMEEREAKVEMTMPEMKAKIAALKNYIDRKTENSEKKENSTNGDGVATVSNA